MKFIINSIVSIITTPILIFVSHYIYSFFWMACGLIITFKKWGNNSLGKFLLQDSKSGYFFGRFMRGFVLGLLVGFVDETIGSRHVSLLVFVLWLATISEPPNLYPLKGILEKTNVSQHSRIILIGKINIICGFIFARLIVFMLIIIISHYFK